MPKDALTRRRGRRPAWFCQEQTLVLTEQFSSMEHDAFHVSYLSDKIPEAVFNGQAVKTVAYLRVSTAQQDVRRQRLAILDALAKAGVAFVAMKGNIRIEGKRNIQTKVMTTLFALFAEVERGLISERTREGLAKAGASGRKLGRPKGSLGVSRLNGEGGRYPALPRAGRFQDRHRQAHGRVPYDPLQLHEHPRAQAAPLACI